MKNNHMHYFVDEAGDPNFYGRKGKNLIQLGHASKVFIIGFIETADIQHISTALQNLKLETSNDDYLKGVPSLRRSLLYFHANADCHEVKERVFKTIKKLDLTFHCVVARKNPNMFERKFNFSKQRFYQYLVSKLFEKRLHIHEHMDIYFSKMGNIVREHTMREAITTAEKELEQKTATAIRSKTRLFIQEPSHIAGLQVVDYFLWAVYRVYSKQDFRYFNFLRDKISLVYDIFETRNYPENEYTIENPLTEKKMSPVE